MKFRYGKILMPVLALMLAGSLLTLPAQRTDAADHGDAPFSGEDRSIDLADVYFFLDPNDNNRVIIIGTLQGFIVPGEAVNFGLFDPGVRFRFQIENTGDQTPDAAIDVTFSAKRNATTDPQTMTVVLPGDRRITAPTTVPTLNTDPPTPVITTDAATGVSVFAGVTDDPFFFDIPGFSRFVVSVRAGTPDPTRLQRGRDSFSGYNLVAIALSLPVTLLGGGDQVGVNLLAQRQTRRIFRDGEVVGRGDFVTLDRMGNPAINVALIPFNRKNEYNFATTLDDANGRFANDIVGTLRALGANPTSINALAEVGVLRGDFLRLRKSVRNTGMGGGNNPEAAFPNGRRLGDDVIDTILTIIANGTRLGDSVNSNDVPFRNAFPFLAPAQQPREGTADDNTRN